MPLITLKLRYIKLSIETKPEFKNQTLFSHHNMLKRPAYSRCLELCQLLGNGYKHFYISLNK